MQTIDAPIPIKYDTCINRNIQCFRYSVLMFGFRCLSNRFLTRSIISYRSRYLSLGAANPQINNEQIQPTLNIIKEDLQLIHRDILQVSKNESKLFSLLLDIC